MKICRGGTRAFALPLVRPLLTAHGALHARNGTLLCLMDEEGRVGFGEATPLEDFGSEDQATSTRSLARALDGLVGRSFDSLADALAASSQYCRDAPSARSALDSALHDLELQRRGRSLASWLWERAGQRGAPVSRISVQALVSGREPDDVAAAARDGIDEGFEAFKLKLAVSKDASDLGLDLERVAALREVVGSSRLVRLDANEAWSLREAELALTSLAGFGIDYVEQPVGRRDREALKLLDAHGAIPIAADEALLGDGLDACLETRAASIFVIKPSVLGGIAPCVEVIRRARESGIRVVLSSLIEAAVGRASAIALAATLGAPGEAHGLGTASLLGRDLVHGCEVDRGQIELSRDAGIGCRPLPVWVEGEDCASEMWGDVRVVEAPS